MGFLLCFMSSSFNSPQSYGGTLGVVICGALHDDDDQPGGSNWTVSKALFFAVMDSSRSGNVYYCDTGVTIGCLVMFSST